jgi:translocation protein SEC63
VEKTVRMYKIQFQAPPTVGAYTFQINFVSDTFVVEDVRQNITVSYLRPFMDLPMLNKPTQLKVEDVSALTADEQGAEDEISDPEEDTIAGQMAAMRGGPVKKLAVSGSDDDESTTDGEQSSGSDSDSDSD